MADLLDEDISRFRGETHGRRIESSATLFWSKKDGGQPDAFTLALYIWETHIR